MLRDPHTWWRITAGERTRGQDCPSRPPPPPQQCLGWGEAVGRKEVQCGGEQVVAKCKREVEQRKKELPIPKRN